MLLTISISLASLAGSQSSTIPRQAWIVTHFPRIWMLVAVLAEPRCAGLSVEKAREYGNK